MNKKIFFILSLFFILFSVSFVSCYEIQYYHNDHLGSPVAITDEAGEVVWSAEYDVFGEADESQDVNDLKYNAKEVDDTGLIYYGSRYYDPDAGRFITADSVKGNLVDTQSQNRYVYVKNNPMKYVDLRGEELEYASQQAEKGFSWVEEMSIYQDMKNLKGRTFVVGSYSNLLEMVNPKSRWIVDFSFANTGGVSFYGGLFKKLASGADENKIYIFFNEIEEYNRQDYERVAIHEGTHAQNSHLILSKNSDVSKSFIRFLEISEESNKFLEEIVTVGRTLDYLVENNFPKEIIKKSQDYFMFNYNRYYVSRKGDTNFLPEGNMNHPLSKDIINGMVEGYYNKYSPCSEWEHRLVKEYYSE